MRVLVDTCVWSLALRRESPSSSSVRLDLEKLIGNGLAVLVGPVRQEVLSGIRNSRQFQKLANRLSVFPDYPIVTEDYVSAAEFHNHCRTGGVQGSHTDFLICAVAVRNDFELFTTDKDFLRFAKLLPVRLYQAKPGDERRGAAKE